jgi:hypothetical protein
MRQEGASPETCAQWVTEIRLLSPPSAHDPARTPRYLHTVGSGALHTPTLVQSSHGRQ